MAAAGMNKQVEHHNNNAIIPGAEDRPGTVLIVGLK